MHATSSPFSAFRAASTSLYGTTNVSSNTFGLSPADSGTSKGAWTPRWRLSYPPCQPPSIFAIFILPVWARARRLAYMLASVPVLVYLTISALGTISTMRSASSISSSWEKPMWVPLLICPSTASITFLGEWPRMRAPCPVQKSVYTLPSTSVILQPSALLT